LAKTLFFLSITFLFFGKKIISSWQNLYIFVARPLSFGKIFISSWQNCYMFFVKFLSFRQNFISSWQNLFFLIPNLYRLAKPLSFFILPKFLFLSNF